MAAGSEASLQEERLLPGASSFFWVTLLLYTVRDSLKASSTENWAIPFLKCFSWIYLKPSLLRFRSQPWLGFAWFVPFPRTMGLCLQPLPAKLPAPSTKANLWPPPILAHPYGKAQPNLLNSTAKPKRVFQLDPSRICSPGWKAHPPKPL